MVSSEVRMLGNVPTLFINRQPVPGMAYITYFRQDARYQQFADVGYQLFSIPVYFGDQGINTVTGIKPFEQGIFSEKNQPDFSILDRQVQQILDILPNAFILPRINMSMPRWWEEENPNECCDTGVNGGPRRSCFSSEKWIHDTLDMLKRFIGYVESAPYADRIFAYMLANGNTEEWFSYDQCGSIGPAARRKYHGDGSPENPEFRRYLSHAAANAICRFAKETKEQTGRHKAVGCFYGYTFEVPFWTSNHHALREVLNSPDVDFLCSPASYTVRNQSGIDWPNMVPIDSLQNAGKLYFMENDTRTNLSKFLKDCHPGACLEHTYDQPIWLGPDSEKKSIHLLRMNFARQLADAHASWWFDMWGGWYDSPAMMKELGEYLNITKMFMKDLIYKIPAECALWIDEAAFAYADPSKEHSLAKQSRVNVGQCGVPFDFYEIGDFSDRGSLYKANVFVVHAETSAVTKAVEVCHKRGIPVMIMHPDEVPSTDEIRKFCVFAGAHCYCSSGDAIHIAPHFAAIHAASDGPKKIRLKHTLRIIPLLDSGNEFVSDVIRIEMKTGETKLFSLEEKEK